MAHYFLLFMPPLPSSSPVSFWSNIPGLTSEAMEVETSRRQEALVLRAEGCPVCLGFRRLLQASQGAQVSPGVGKGL